MNNNLDKFKYEVHSPSDSYEDLSNYYEWLYNNFGESGNRWSRIFNHIGIRPYTIFRFRKESDAILFKITWC